MNPNQGAAGVAGNGPEANQSPLNSRAASCGNVIAFPINRTRQHLEAVMLQHRDDAGQCRNGLSSRDFRQATAADRTTYRKWLLGMVVFYCTLLLIFGVVAIVTDVSPGLTRLTSLSTHTTPASPRAH
jgi:hypothetical protein